MIEIQKKDPEVFSCIKKELSRQQFSLEMIASENFTSLEVMEAMSSVLTNKYAEGYPGKRYYGGCEYVDEVENITKDRLNQLFKSKYSNVQPHSGSQANMGVYFTFLKPNDIVLGLDLAHGGHLTHGSKVNFSGNLYNFISYGVNKKTGRVDFDQLFALAKKHKPKMIVCGGSAYPRFIEFEKFREIADSVNAFLMADIAHPSGLVAANLHPSPWPYCHIATSTTHKTLRGPRGGIILMGEDFENPWGIKAPKSGRTKMLSELIDSSVMPGIQGGPLMHVIAAKAVAFKQALNANFKEYSKQTIINAKVLSNELMELGYDIITNGTDTHLVLVDLTKNNISGKAAENALERAGITINKNMVPYDQRSPLITSGIRLGTPAITTRGMKEEELLYIAKKIDLILKNIDNDKVIDQVKNEIVELCNCFTLYEGYYDLS